MYSVSQATVPPYRAPQSSVLFIIPFNNYTKPFGERWRQYGWKHQQYKDTSQFYLSCMTKVNMIISQLPLALG